MKDYKKELEYYKKEMTKIVKIKDDEKKLVDIKLIIVEEFYNFTDKNITIMELQTNIFKRLNDYFKIDE